MLNIKMLLNDADVKEVKTDEITVNSLLRLAGADAIAPDSKKSANTKMIKLTELTRENYNNRPEILEKYFRTDNHDLDRFHIPALTKKIYEEYTANIKTSIANKNFDTATDYFKFKVRKELIAADLGVNVKCISFKDYIWDERYYKYYSFLENIFRVDDMYRDNNDSIYDKTAYDCYISEDPRTGSGGEELCTELYQFCLKCVRTRKAMLFGKVDKCISCVNNIIDYTFGFNQNPTLSQLATLRNYKQYFETLLKDTEFTDFIKSTSDYEIFYKDENTKQDYVDTYRSMLRSVQSGGDNLEYFVEILQNNDKNFEDINAIIYEE